MRKIRAFLYTDFGKGCVFVLAMIFFLSIIAYGATHGGLLHRVIIFTR